MESYFDRTLGSFFRLNALHYLDKRATVLRGIKVPPISTIRLLISIRRMQPKPDEQALALQA